METKTIITCIANNIIIDFWCYIYLIFYLLLFAYKNNCIINNYRSDRLILLEVIYI